MEKDTIGRFQCECMEEPGIPAENQSRLMLSRPGWFGDSMPIPDGMSPNL